MAQPRAIIHNPPFLPEHQFAYDRIHETKHCKHKEAREKEESKLCSCAASLILEGTMIDLL